MTSGACQLGEPQSTANSLASSTLPVGRRQVVGEKIELVVDNVCSVTEERDTSNSFQQRQQNRRERLSIESSDSEQLSSVSSFGSLSIGGYQLNNSANHTSASNDSASHLSADTEQHRFYCSLMLLNSLDFCHYEQAKSERQQQQFSSPKLQSSSNAELDAKLSLDIFQKSMLDCRANCFASEQIRAVKEKGVSNQSVEKTKEVKVLVEENKKPKSSGVLGVDWHRQKTGKFVAAAAAATNSVSFVDKLLTHMVKKSGSSSSNRTTTGASSPNCKHSSSNAQKQETMNSRGDQNTPDRGSGVEEEKQKATHSSGVGGSIHLLSDLSRRLARRCGVKTKTVPMDGSVKHVSDKEGVPGGGSSLKRDTSEAKSTQLLSTGTENVINRKNKEPQLEKKSRENHISSVSSSYQSQGFNQSQLSSNISQASQLITASSLADRSKVNITNSVSKIIEDQHRQAQHQSNNSNNSDLTSASHLYASISTLNTAPSNCCLCDNETCSSSGFVSSSTTGVGGGGSSGCGGISGGTNSCVNGESTTATHSCSSLAYNEPIPNTGSSSFGYSNSFSLINTPDSSGSNNQSQINNCCWPSPQREQQQQAHQHKNHCDVPILTTCSEQNADPNSENRVRIGMETLGQVSPSGHISQNQLSQPTVVNIELIGNQEQPPTMTEVKISKAKEGQGVRDQNKSPSSTKKDSSGGDLLKPKTSLLTKARNSTINLASLATVTSKFNCSTSVGNLWHGSGAQHHNNQIELAENSAIDGIQPIDYIKGEGFDSYHPDESDNCIQQQVKEPISIKSSSSHKLLSVASCGSTKKLSTKEKCKRQKDAERVEKLRLLVSYLKSGSSQPVVNPVALEADEIELAERYKSHMILRDALLCEAQTGDQQQEEQPKQQQQQTQLSLLDSTKLTEGASDKQLSGTSDGSKNPMISHSIGGTTTSSPASSSSGSMNQAHSTNDRRSIPHISNVTWVLRHSISDPGNTFEHSPAFSSSSSQNHPSHQYDHHRSQEQQHAHHHQHNLHDVDASADHSFNRSDIHHHSDYANCESCAQGTSYSGSSLNNYSICSNISKINPKQPQQQQAISSQFKSPKLFYIDDTDFLQTSTPSGPSVAPVTPTISTITTITTQPSSNALVSVGSTYCSQSTTPAISSTSSGVGSNRNSSSGSTSAWSNPQNLATWIDNEVNSLVHDLEANSQQLSGKSEGKQSKSGKRKWLSVTSGSARRNSSGAQST